MKKLFIGRSPLTTIAGYLVAILTGLHQASASGSHQWQDYLLPAAIALFGRFAGDEKNQQPPTPSDAPAAEDVLPESTSTSFQRRGKEHRQPRGSNGRFGPSVA